MGLVWKFIGIYPENGKDKGHEETWERWTWCWIAVVELQFISAYDNETASSKKETAH